jgi:hypothetical protein
MSVEFYRKGDEIWMRAAAGGHGGDATSVFESRANDNDFEQHWSEYQVFLASDVPPVDYAALDQARLAQAAETERLRSAQEQAEAQEPPDAA